MNRLRFAFCASTGRTATMFLASTLNTLHGVSALHEGQLPGNPPKARLPLINLQNRKAWYDPAEADRTVATLRDTETLSKAANGAQLLVDVAFYNAPLLGPLASYHPDSRLFVIIRRCEGFVRSATIVTGEDLQPAGWPDRLKPLTDREQFISLGRLKPRPGSNDAAQWPDWSAIQRNIWLWYTVNSHLIEVAETYENCHALLYEDLVDNPQEFWTYFLRELNLGSGSNITQCVKQSMKKLNQRSSYQVGPADTWDSAELTFYKQLACPLEQKIYA